MESLSLLIIEGNNEVEDIEKKFQRVLTVPLGIALKENADQHGTLLRKLMLKVENNENKKGIWSPDRTSRVFVCFGGNYGGRQEILRWALEYCTICDFCGNLIQKVNKKIDPSEVLIPNLPHEYLWGNYTRYKFVLSPFGVGRDCHRTFEIGMLGAIPVVPYFHGLSAYLQHNIF